ncbi:MAG: DUF1049 domain-containing protein [Candidatus Schekmanbacteria bacterium]|nr:MAG: DUF1049 domain-containing protein [Candidatus Schekmanbacteria bacterium]
MKKLKGILITFILLLVVIFAVQNASTVELRFLIWNASIPCAFLVLLIMAIGILIGILISNLGAFKKS